MLKAKAGIKATECHELRLINWSRPCIEWTLNGIHHTAQANPDRTGVQAERVSRIVTIRSHQIIKDFLITSDNRAIDLNKKMIVRPINGRRPRAASGPVVDDAKHAI
jgi:hypothetical protein